jgi:hypothetical protein
LEFTLLRGKLSHKNSQIQTELGKGEKSFKDIKGTVTSKEYYNNNVGQGYNLYKHLYHFPL